MAHEDDPLRGVLAALKASNTLKKLGIHSRIGVTTGRAFCGLIGNEKRQEYTIIGDVVNLSARLMQHTSTGEILCDEATYLSAKHQITFETLSRIQVKGKHEPIATFRPLYKQEQSQFHGNISLVIGRKQEKKILQDTINAFHQSDEPALIIIEGEAGIGKSSLLSYFRQMILDQEKRFAYGGGNSIERTTPFHGWAPILIKCLQLHNYPADRWEIEMMKLLKEWHPDLCTLAPLLNTLLPFDLQENETTQPMKGDVRAHQINQLFIQILKYSTLNVLIMEDAQWLDSASWKLLQTVHEECPDLFLVIAMRPFEKTVPAQFKELTELDHCQQLILEGLSSEDAIELACKELGVSSLPDEVLELVREKAKGHPFYIEEVLHALQEAQFIFIEEGHCQINPSMNFADLQFSDSLESIITTRIDRLSPQEQLTLKVASVIGHVFAYHVLASVYPVSPDKKELPTFLKTLEHLKLTTLDIAEPDMEYIFKHILIKDVAYNLMTFAQRKQIHHSIALWYEETYANHLQKFYPILAYHWQQADHLEKALFYLEKSGKQALINGTYQEAIQFFKRALELAVKLELQDHLKIAYLKREIGEALFSLGHFEDSEIHLIEALELLNYSLPSSAFQIKLNLLKQ